MVAVIAHALAVIRRDVFGLDSDPGQTAAAALFHDAGEIFTGDLPTPIKYFDPDIITAYKRVETVAAGKLLTALPEELRPEYDRLFSTESSETYKLVKAADTLAAYIKCIEELKTGNLEFRMASDQTRKKLETMRLPEVDYFIKNFIPAFELTLDELDFAF